MAELSNETRGRIEQYKHLARELAQERGMSDYSKVGNFLPVALGVRPLSLTYLPAELPGGGRLGEAIDKYFADNYTPPGAGSLNRFFRRKGGADAVDPEAELQAKRKTLDEAYNKLVVTSPAYLAHLAWLDKLDLDQVQIKRRPSLREMFIYRDRATRETLMALETIADEARTKAAQRSGRDRDQMLIEYVYANEFEPRYLEGLGRLLGYPECCIAAYTADRASGRNVEQRAWEQVRDKHELGESVDVRAYFLKDFFPCHPDCPQAIAQGELYEALYDEFDQELREVYTGVLWSNFELVQNYPMLIDQHRRRLEQGPRQ